MPRVSTNRVCASETRGIASLQIVSVLRRRDASRLYKSCLCFGDARHRVSTNRVCASACVCPFSLKNEFSQGIHQVMNIRD